MASEHHRFTVFKSLGGEVSATSRDRWYWHYQSRNGEVSVVSGESDGYATRDSAANSLRAFLDDMNNELDRVVFASPGRATLSYFQFMALAANATETPDGEVGPEASAEPLGDASGTDTDGSAGPALGGIGG